MFCWGLFVLFDSKKQKAKNPKSWCYLSGQHTEEDENEHPLEGVGDGEQIGSEGCLIENVQDSKRPGGTEHKQQSQGTTGTGPEREIAPI